MQFLRKYNTIKLKKAMWMHDGIVNEYKDMYTLLHDRCATYYVLWTFTVECQTLCQERRFILDETGVLVSYVVRPATSTMLI